MATAVHVKDILSSLLTAYSYNYGNLGCYACDREWPLVYGIYSI